jgi:hypothetical protein
MKKKLPVLAPAEQMRCVPIRNARAEIAGEGPILKVTVPLTYPGAVRPLKRLLKLRETKTFELEGVGKAVFEKVDDERPIEGIVDWFAADYALSFHEARALVMGYLKTLTENGLIVIAGMESSFGSD